jgi:hypothetical protein
MMDADAAVPPSTGADGSGSDPATTDPAGTGGGGDGSGGDSSGGDGGGGDYSTDPPGTTGSSADGCDVASGECDVWEEEITAALIARQMAAGCDRAMVTDERIDTIAENHAAYQAMVDMITTDSPDGNLFDQVGDAGVEFRDVAALFSVTVRGSEDVVSRWAAGADTRDVLTRCDSAIGVGVATAESGDSYVTVLMARF